MNLWRDKRGVRGTHFEANCLYLEYSSPFFPLLKLAFLEARYIFIFDRFTHFVEFSESSYKGIQRRLAVYRRLRRPKLQDSNCEDVPYIWMRTLITFSEGWGALAEERVRYES